MARNPIGSAPAISGSAFAKATELQQRLWFTLGALLVLSGAFCWSLGQVMVRGLNGKVGGFTLICWIGIFSSPQMFIMSLLIDCNTKPIIISPTVINCLTIKS